MRQSNEIIRLSAWYTYITILLLLTSRSWPAKIDVINIKENTVSKGIIILLYVQYTALSMQSKSCLLVEVGDVEENNISVNSISKLRSAILFLWSNIDPVFRNIILIHSKTFRAKNIAKPYEELSLPLASS